MSGGSMAVRNEVDCEEVVVLSADKLEGVHINGIRCPAARRLLTVVVLVDKPVARSCG
jgi:hypothetical protein